MTASGKGNGKSGIAAGALLTGAVGVLALPSAVLAFSTRFEPRPAPATQAAENQTTAVGIPGATHLAAAAPMRSLARGPLYPFTPAGTPNRPDRSVTVAVRVDDQTVRTITVRGNRRVQGAEGGNGSLRIAPTAFNLGVSRGYHSFAQNLLPTPDIRKIDMPDLASIKAPGTAAPAPSRFSPRIVIDEGSAAGRAPRTFAGDNNDKVDVGGSYRLTRNLDVTAGVRYSQERERLRPLTDGKQDSQAVYVGTQFRF